jgi:hypothetical protein
MNQPRDDEYGSLHDLFGDEPEGTGDAGADEDLPRGVAPEYAEAYRQGYERARLGEEPTVLIEREQREATTRATHDIPARPAPAAPAAASLPSYDEELSADEERRKKRLAAIGLGVMALVLVLAAFGIGKLFAENAAEVQSDAEADGSTKSQPSEGAKATQPYKGPVDAVTIGGASASCQSASSVDAAGNPTSYEPARAHDSDLSTAWRCDGSGVGQKLTVSLPEWTPVAQVGLVPGYAKTDPVSGVDRYAENNRITKVRWRFDDGTSFVQTMNGNPSDRSMRMMRVPETSTSSLVIEILASRPGARNTVAISEIRVGTPAD